jgi:hypothetical protein
MQAQMSGTNTMLEALDRIAADPAQRVYVLMDGARFDDLPGMLVVAGLSHRSLYRNVQDAELVRAGPWLVDPYRKPDPAMNAWGGLPFSDTPARLHDDEVAADTEAALNEGASNDDHSSSFPAAPGDPDPVKQLEQVAATAAGTPAAVFWIGDANLTEVNLWRHLRTLNMVLIPKGYREDDPPPVERGGETHDALMFRHADGNVLAEVLPVLDAAQFSRVFGPAKALMFLAPEHPDSDGSTVRRAVLPDDAPPSPPGMLRLSMDQMEGIEEIRLERLELRLVKYLREVTGMASSKDIDRKVTEQVKLSIASSRYFGFKRESSFRRWTYLIHLTEGRIRERSDITRFIAKGEVPPHVSKSGPPVPPNPDARMKAAMEQTIAHFKRVRGEVREGPV